MDLSDDDLLMLFRVDPINVPTTMICRCLHLLHAEGDRSRLIRSVTRRRPRTERERLILLHYALNHKMGGVAFIDMLGGFSRRPV